MSKVYVCPKCKNELEQLVACGAEQYFCDTCKELVSRSKIIEKEEKK